MKSRMLAALVMVALVGTLSAGCAAGAGEADFDALQDEVTALRAEVDALSMLQDRMDIEDLIRTYACSMDELDKETWLSVFSDNLESYAVYESGGETPLIMFPVPGQEGTAKEQLAGMCSMMIFDRVLAGQSALSNLIVDVHDETSATARDYFAHWEIVNPTAMGSIAQGMDVMHWYFQEGTHDYMLAREEGGWKITRFTGHLYRTEARERQDFAPAG